MGLLLSFSTIPSWITPSAAQVAVTFKPPGRLAPKTATVGGASRGICGADKTGSLINNMKAVMPSTNIGLTMAERPRIYAYVPSGAKEAVFSMVDEKGHQYHMAMLNLPNKAGVMEVTLPDSLPPLQMNQDYKWSILMICGEELDTDSPAIEGWVRRVEGDRNLVSQGNQPASLDLAAKLAQNSVWYETVSTLATLRQEQPNNANVKAAWQQVLGSVGLEPIANAPIIEVQQQ